MTAATVQSNKIVSNEVKDNNGTTRATVWKKLFGQPNIRINHVLIFLEIVFKDIIFQ